MKPASGRGRAALLAWTLILSGCASSPGMGIAGDAGASACGECHTSEFAAWSTSRLASSGTSPVFEALTAKVAASWGETARERCVTCHQPGFGGDHGIGCVSCHSATGNLATRDGLLTVDLGVPGSGPFNDPISTPAHGSREYGLLQSPDLCGTCHEVTGPGLLVENTLDEFNASGLADAGTSCTTCHMPEIATGAIAVGQTQFRSRADHSFVGVDPPWGASPAEQAAAATRTLILLRTGLTLGATATADGQGLLVTVTNQAGHAIPTGATYLRGVWVDVALAGDDGVTSAVPAVITLDSQPMLEGQPVALLTQADSVKASELAAGGTVSVRVPYPAGLVSPVSAVVTLRARAIRAEVLDALGLADSGAEVPTHEVQVVHVPE